MKDFIISNIKYSKKGETLTFNFKDGSERVCVGIFSIEEIAQEIINIIKQINEEE